MRCWHLRPRRPRRIAPWRQRPPRPRCILFSPAEPAAIPMEIALPNSWPPLRAPSVPPEDRTSLNGSQREAAAPVLAAAVATPPAALPAIAAIPTVILAAEPSAMPTETALRPFAAAPQSPQRLPRTAPKWRLPCHAIRRTPRWSAMLCRHLRLEAPAPEDTAEGAAKVAAAQQPRCDRPRNPRRYRPRPHGSMRGRRCASPPPCPIAATSGACPAGRRSGTSGGRRLCAAGASARVTCAGCHVEEAQGGQDDTGTRRPRTRTGAGGCSGMSPRRSR